MHQICVHFIDHPVCFWKEKRVRVILKVASREVVPPLKVKKKGEPWHCKHEAAQFVPCSFSALSFCTNRKCCQEHREDWGSLCKKWSCLRRSSLDICLSDLELLYRSLQPTVTKKVISDVQGYNSFKSSVYQTCLCMQIQNVTAFENFSLWQEVRGYAWPDFPLGPRE